MKKQLSIALFIIIAVTFAAFAQDEDSTPSCNPITQPCYAPPCEWVLIVITGTAARAITWGTSFEASTVALPTTTVTTARLDVGFVYNTVTSKWRCVAAA